MFLLIAVPANGPGQEIWYTVTLIGHREEYSSDSKTTNGIMEGVIVEIHFVRKCFCVTIGRIYEKLWQ